MSNIKVVVTGIGVVSPNGIGKQEFINNTYNGVSGLSKSRLLSTFNIYTDIAGEIKLQEELSPEEKYIMVASMALKEAYEDAGLNAEYIESLGARAAASLASSNISSISLERYSKLKAKGEKSNENLLCDIVLVKELMRMIGTRGEMYLTNSACASGTAAAGIAYDLIKNSVADLVVISAVDILNDISSLGFNSLQTLSKNGCKPFDKKRDGISIGEAGTIIVFESEESAKRRNAKIYCEVAAYALANDAYHYTTPDPEGKGACYCISQCMKEANIGVEDIGYINAHGTGTILNDSMESKAIKDLGLQHVPISSTKSMVGHCLGAAGGIELAATILALDKGIVLPSIAIEQVDSELEEVNIVRDRGYEKEYTYALSNSFAFAGNCASILVRKWN